MVIKEPIGILYRYSPSGYIWLKCTNLSLQPLTIRKVELVNWLVSSHPELKKF
jgi:hypothetical protein